MGGSPPFHTTSLRLTVAETETLASARTHNRDGHICVPNTLILVLHFWHPIVRSCNQNCVFKIMSPRIWVCLKGQVLELPWSTSCQAAAPRWTEDPLGPTGDRPHLLLLGSAAIVRAAWTLPNFIRITGRFPKIPPVFS